MQTILLCAVGIFVAVVLVLALVIKLMNQLFLSRLARDQSIPLPHWTWMRRQILFLMRLKLEELQTTARLNCPDNPRMLTREGCVTHLNVLRILWYWYRDYSLDGNTINRLSRMAFAGLGYDLLSASELHEVLQMQSRLNHKENMHVALSRMIDTVDLPDEFQFICNWGWYILRNENLREKFINKCIKAGTMIVLQNFLGKDLKDQTVGRMFMENRDKRMERPQDYMQTLCFLGHWSDLQRFGRELEDSHFESLAGECYVLLSRHGKLHTEGREAATTSPE